MLKKIAAIVTFILITISLWTTAIGYIDAETGETEDNVVELDGSIIAEIHEEHFGAISLSTNLSKSQTLECNAVKTGDDTYYVNSVLKIDIDVVGNVDGQYLLGRYITIRISIIRENKKILPLRGLLQRWFVGKPLTTIRINILSKGEKHIELPLQFETNAVSENVTMHIFATRTPPSLFLIRCQPAFISKKIKLELVYKTSNNNDFTPPVTTCELRGELFRRDII